MYRISGLIISGFEVYAPPAVSPQPHPVVVHQRPRLAAAAQGALRTRLLRVLAELHFPLAYRGRMP